MVPPLTRFVILVTTKSEAPSSAIKCNLFLVKNQAADNKAYFSATKVGLAAISSLIDLPNAV